MYETYGLGQPTPWSVRTMNELLHGTAQQRRATEQAARPLSAGVAEAAMVTEVSPPTPVPYGPVQGLGELVAANAVDVVFSEQGALTT